MINLRVIRKYAEQMPDKVAVDDSNSGQSITWLELQGAVEKKILFFLSRFERGLPKQACYISHNRIELMAWLAAFATLSIPVTGLDYSLPHETLIRLLRTIEADFLLSSSSILSKEQVFETSTLDCVHFDLDSPTIVFADAVGKSLDVDILEYLSGLGAAPPFRAVGVTSGTNGLPKAVIRTRSFDQRRFQYFTNRYQFDQEDEFLLSMPLYHAAGNGWARMFMNLGATVHFALISSPENIAGMLCKKGITATVMTPALLGRVLDVLDPGEYARAGRLRWVLVGGKHYPAAQKLRALSVLGPVIYEYYGTTETGVNTIAEPADMAAHPGSVGRAFDGNEIVVVDQNGADLGLGKVGSVAISSYMNMDNYSDGSAREVNIEGQRYLLTSEAGYLDLHGRLYLLNRSNQHNNHSHIYRLEDAIRKLPSISDVALVQRGECHPSGIECAIQVGEPQVDPSYLGEQVSSLAAKENLQLVRYSIVPQIPYSPSGKVRVSELLVLLDKFQTEPALVGVAG